MRVLLRLIGAERETKKPFDAELAVWWLFRFYRNCPSDFELTPALEKKIAQAMLGGANAYEAARGVAEGREIACDPDP